MKSNFPIYLNWPTLYLKPNCFQCKILHTKLIANSFVYKLKLVKSEAYSFCNKIKQNIVQPFGKVILLKKNSGMHFSLLLKIYNHIRSYISVWKMFYLNAKSNRYCQTSVILNANLSKYIS